MNFSIAKLKIKEYNVIVILWGVFMELHKNRIRTEGIALNSDILKVDMFLNHQVDAELLDACGEAFAKAFENDGVTKVLTVEASGIPLAFSTALRLKVPFVFAKKGSHSNIGTDLYAADCHSFTKNMDYAMVVSKKFINANDNILIIDDFLANGAACNGLMNIVEQAGAKLCGIGIAIEKGFQPGGENIRKKGIKLCSLAIVEEMG